MTDDELFNINFALKRVLENPQLATSVTSTKRELLSWTLTYLVKQGDTVSMKTIFIPEQKK